MTNGKKVERTHLWVRWFLIMSNFWLLLSVIPSHPHGYDFFVIESGNYRLGNKDKAGKEVSRPLLSFDKEGRGSQYITYGRGQPMGALSSWGALALLHHAVLQFAAHLVGEFPFYDYRILGGDIVFSGKAVAESYRSVCAHFGIEIRLVKSFISDSGFFNFANQSLMGTDNISPISFKQELSLNTGIARLGVLVSAIERGWVDMGANNFM